MRVGRVDKRISLRAEKEKKMDKNEGGSKLQTQRSWGSSPALHKPQGKG